MITATVICLALFFIMLTLAVFVFDEDLKLAGLSCLLLFAAVLFSLTKFVIVFNQW